MTDNRMPPGFGPNDPTAPDRAVTEYADASFDTSEHAPPAEGEESHPWIWAVIEEPGLSLLKRGDAFLGLQCREGVSVPEVAALAREMRRLLCGVSCTRFVT